MNKTFLKTAIGVVLTASLFSCSNEIEDLNTPSADVYKTSSKQEIMTEFAKALSSVVSENQDARELIKTEALKKFDKNYDILWDEIKDKSIGSCTLREAIAQKTSNEFIMQAEEKVPLLNILFPEISMFGISPEKYSSSDEELPVVAATSDKDLMYYAGELTDEIKKGDVPAFNVLVVNENKLVEVDETATRGAKRTYKLKYETYNVTRSESDAKSSLSPSLGISDRLKEAYEYFYKTDNSNQRQELQRDYVYYGMTPQKTSGEFDKNYAEYIHFIEVDPNAYYLIADQGSVDGRTDAMFRYGDTYVTAERKKSDFTKEELIREIWTAGCYNFRFEIVKSTEQKVIVENIIVTPSDIWDFHEMDHREYRHSTLFRSSKYTYTIDLQYFTAKKYYLPVPICLGTWNPKTESLTRKVIVYEEDDSAEEEFNVDYDIVKMNSSKFSGNGKIGLGVGKFNIEVGGGAEDVSQNTTTIKKTVKVKRPQNSDYLGTADIYYYHPLILGKIQIPIPLFGTTDIYYERTYICGPLRFGIDITNRTPFIGNI